MLNANVMSDMKKAIREGRARSTFGTAVSVDDVFSDPSQLQEIIDAMNRGGASPTSLAQTHTWSVVEPSAPLATMVTTIAHYALDEASGTSGADASQNGNDITVSGAAWASGKFDGCLTFDGSNDQASVTAVSAEPLRNYLYVSCWINPSSVTGTRPICKLADRFVLYLNAGVVTCQIIDGSTTYTVASGLTAVTGSWQFVTLQYIDGAVYLALGDLVYKETIAAVRFAEEYPAAGKALTIAYDGTNFYAGSIDELLIEANVRVMDDWPVVDDASMMNDIAFWPFAENTGTAIFSGSLLGPQMTMVGGTWTTGKTRYAVAFDGSNDYASCTPSAETFTGHKLSIEVGIKFGVDAACPILTQAGGLNIAYNGAGGITAALSGVSNPNSILGTLTVDTAVFYNLTVVYDGTMKELWINGQKYGEVAATGTAVMPAVEMFLARDGASYGNCTIDRVRIYRARLRPFYRAIKYFTPGINGFQSNDEWMVQP